MMLACAPSQVRLSSCRRSLLVSAALHLTHNSACTVCVFVRPLRAGFRSELRELPIQHLSLSNNGIGEKGIFAFMEALADGALPMLKTIKLGDNPGADDQALCEQVRKTAREGLKVMF